MLMSLLITVVQHRKYYQIIQCLDVQNQDESIYGACQYFRQLKYSTDLQYLNMNNQPYYSVTQVVWAKIRGYPWWPAIISNVDDADQTDIQYKVNFFGDTTHSFLDETKISKFEENYPDNQVFGRSNKKLAKSILQAEEHLKEKGLKLNLIRKPAKIKQIKSCKESNISKTSQAAQGNSSDPIPKENKSRQLDQLQGISPSKSQSQIKPPKRQQPKRNVIVEKKILQSQQSVHESESEQIKPIPKIRNAQKKQVKKIQIKNITNTKLQSFEGKQSPQKKVQHKDSKLSVLSQKLLLRVDEKQEAEKKQRKEKIKDLIEQVKKYASGPQQILDYLISMDINVENVKQILDCDVVDILHSIPSVTSNQLLSKMRSTLLDRYFSDQVESRSKPHLEKSKPQKQKQKKGRKGKQQRGSIREETVSKFEDKLKDCYYNLRKQKVREEARKFQELIFEKDTECQEQYQQHVSVLLDQLQLRKYSIGQLKDLINALAQIKQSF